VARNGITIVRETGGIAPQFLTSVLDGSEWSASRPGKQLPTFIGEEVVLASEPIWRLRRRAKFLVPVKNRTLILRPTSL
jgi:hypothetical protein